MNGPTVRMASLVMGGAVGISATGICLTGGPTTYTKNLQATTLTVSGTANFGPVQASVVNATSLLANSLDAIRDVSLGDRSRCHCSYEGHQVDGRHRIVSVACGGRQGGRGRGCDLLRKPEHWRGGVEHTALGWGGHDGDEPRGSAVRYRLELQRQRPNAISTAQSPQAGR